MLFKDQALLAIDLHHQELNIADLEAKMVSIIHTITLKF
jgi:hypothetical protein